MGYLTDAQRLFWETNGYLVVPDALDAPLLAELRDAADHAERRWWNDPSLPGVRIPEFLEIEAIMEYGGPLFELVDHPSIFPLIREVLGKDAQIIDHAYYITPPGGKVSGNAWHRDVRCPGVYHPRSAVMVRAMYALTDIAADGGATLVLPGSHRYPEEFELPQVDSPEKMPGAVALEMPAGAAYFFNGYLMHSPSSNRSATTRRVLLYNYGHKWMRIWKGHEPSEWLAGQARTPLRRQLLGRSGAYFGEEAELDRLPEAVRAASAPEISRS